MNAVLKQLVEKFGTYEVDWMGFTLNKKNPLTYHHIQKDCDDGKKTIENGAPLTRKAHRLLNCIEKNDTDLYDEWNALFREINESGVPPTEEQQEKIKTLRLKSAPLAKMKKRK